MTGVTDDRRKRDRGSPSDPVRAAGAALRAALSERAVDDSYDRRRVLPRLIAIDPSELERGGATLDKDIRRRLARALRAERRSGLAGHWTYDLNRHLALLQAFAAESRRKKRRPAEPGGASGDSDGTAQS